MNFRFSACSALKKTATNRTSPCKPSSHRDVLECTTTNCSLLLLKGKGKVQPKQHGGTQDLLELNVSGNYLQHTRSSLQNSQVTPAVGVEMLNNKHTECNFL